MIRQGIYVEDGEEAYYIYELTMGGRSQTGVVGCAAVDDYLSGVIKKHENTREEKEQDRIRHVDALNAQTGPIFLAYRASEAVSRAVERYKSGEALCDFTAADGVRHRVWKVSGEERIRNLEKLFAAIPGGLHRRRPSPGGVGGEGVLETAGGASRLHGGGAVQLLPLRPVSPRPAADPAPTTGW